MITLLSGIAVARRTPLSLLPTMLESALASVLVLVGVFAADAAAVSAAGVYPMGLYHDLKQALAFATWPVFVLAVIASVAIRTLVPTMTFWLSEGRQGPASGPWRRMLRWSGLALATLFPSAVLYTVGVAVRYAPFIWIGGAVGVLSAALLARGAVAMDAGSGLPQTATVPEIGSFLGYGFVLSGAAALVQTSVDARWAWALLLLAFGPLNGLMLLGWRERLRAGRRSKSASLVLAVAILGPLVLLGITLNDRLFRNPQPQDRIRRDARLALLQGVDSTSETGALREFDPRDVGVARGRLSQLSYRGAGEPYEADDTRADLDRTADLVAHQLRELDEPVLMLGHSQASLIIDRVLRDGAPGNLQSVAVFAPPPGTAAPTELREGTPGHLAAAGFAALLDLVGVTPFDVDAPASPTNLDDLQVPEADVPRLALWALGDSVWLDGDWRRPGEYNVAVITDHVGITKNGRALGLTATFFRANSIDDDETSWRGLLVEVLRYSFGPWRPDR